ncbi:MAG: histidine--tRNA ligase [Nanoarchaeota archaeon]|nr:histidine--tRNA ligase [Nanoarchaeota archaeon]
MFQPPKGMRDFLPDQARKRQWMLDQIRAVFARYGYGLLETPVVESWELLAAKSSGDGIKDEIYSFKDKGDRELGLRFDLTVPTARVIAANPQFPKPFRRAQIGPVYRYDNPQAGRFREFLQCDADVFGVSTMAAEAELLALAVDALTALGFSAFSIRLNNRKILNDLLNKLTIPATTAPAVFRALDKLEKIGEAAVREELAGVLKQQQIDELFAVVRLTGSPDQLLKKVEKQLPGDGVLELKELVAAAKKLSPMMIIDFSLVRGLDYYTGPIFEISIASKNNIGSVAGGGRYDKLVEQYGGKDTPATGISLGFERLYEIMDAEKRFPATLDQGATVLVAGIGNDPAVAREVDVVAAALRNDGIATVVDLLGRDLKKQLHSANSQKIPFVVVIGEEEQKTKKFTLKDMTTGKQAKVPLTALIAGLKKRAAF